MTYEFSDSFESDAIRKDYMEDYTILTKCVKYEGVLLNWVGKHSDFFLIWWGGGGGWGGNEMVLCSLFKVCGGEGGGA